MSQQLKLFKKEHVLCLEVQWTHTTALILQSIELTYSVNHLATIMSPIVSTCHTLSTVLVLPSLNVHPEQVYMTSVEKVGDCHT